MTGQPFAPNYGGVAAAGGRLPQCGGEHFCGASNISFGLPNRHGINNAFLPMAMGAGMTSAIMNPITLPVNPSIAVLPSPNGEVDAASGAAHARDRSQSAGRSGTPWVRASDV